MRMESGDRYPQALNLAESRFTEELGRLGASGSAPRAGTIEFDELRRLYVPPYPVDRFVDKWRKLDPDEPSWTIPAHLEKDGYSHIHYDKDQARTISIREAARLQSFPDSFRFIGNMGQCFRQVGNAVPPLLAWSIASHVLEGLGLYHRPPPLVSRVS